MLPAQAPDQRQSRRQKLEACRNARCCYPTESQIFPPGRRLQEGKGSTSQYDKRSSASAPRDSPKRGPPSLTPRNIRCAALSESEEKWRKARSMLSRERFLAPSRISGRTWM